MLDIKELKQEFRDIIHDAAERRCQLSEIPKRMSVLAVKFETLLSMMNEGDTLTIINDGKEQEVTREDIEGDIRALDNVRRRVADDPETAYYLCRATIAAANNESDILDDTLIDYEVHKIKKQLNKH